jgi:hypothetical protein
LSTIAHFFEYHKDIQQHRQDLNVPIEAYESKERNKLEDKLAEKQSEVILLVLIVDT